MSEDLKAKVNWFVEEGLNKISLQAFHEFYTQESVKHIPPQSDIEGLENIISFATGLRKDVFSGVRMTIHQIVAEEDVAVSRWTWEGTHIGQKEFFPIPPTGKKVTITGCTVYRFEDDKCVEEWEFGDNLSLMMQLGVFPSRSDV